MGRKKIELSSKKQKISIAISNTNLNRLNNFDVQNKSKFIEWLLENYFNNINISNNE